jgi:type IV pilus assembly protein PilB
MNTMGLPRPQLQDLLIANSLIDQKAFADLDKVSTASGKPIEEALVEHKIITDEDLGKLVAKSLNIPYVHLKDVTIADEIFTLIPERIARSDKMIAFAKDAQGLSIAMSYPHKSEILDMLARKIGLPLRLFVATDKDIDDTLLMYKKDLQKVVDSLIKEDIQVLSDDDPPVAKIVDALVETASRDKASDIHMEPEEKGSVVRLRIDGVLHEVLHVSKYLHDRMVTRIKVLSSLRTDEHMAAQDGKMKFEIDSERLDIRVSIIPIVEGEKVVMRLLASSSQTFTLQDLGMSEMDLAKVERAYSKSYGMVLSTGPTGSGKTTSIYSMLKILNTREKNLTSIEDPVEYHITGANQVQVNTKTNLTFANGLRSLLRQDPNIIFVGEIRDSETAGIAVNAALTGHLVFSTLHTNDAATAIPRLVDMKVEPFLVASTVNVIIAQRLVRKICDSCRVSEVITFDQLAKNLPKEIILKHYNPVGKDKEIRVYKGRGCKVCHMTGYHGRIGVYEVLEVSKSIRELVAKRSDSDTIFQAAIAEGMTTMLDDGLQKIAKGSTTIEEVLRVTKTEFL